jgi:hypothetical protein
LRVGLAIIVASIWNLPSHRNRTIGVFSKLLTSTAGDVQPRTFISQKLIIIVTSPEDLGFS